MTPWTPPASLRSWLAEYDPDNPRYARNPSFAQYVAQLLGSSPAAFAALEEQLISTAHLAGITAAGLSDAKAADWQGQAADQYRHTLGELPQDLHQVNRSYTAALGALCTFADTSLELKAKYVAFQDQLAGLKQTWAAALDTTYPDAVTGWATIHRLQGELSDVCTSGIRTLQASVDAGYELGGRIRPLAAAAPHESNLTRALAPIRWIEDAAKDLWHGVTGTGSAIAAFADNPSWSTLGDMTEDLSIDASVIVLAAAAPEALAGLGLIDAGADSSILAVSSGIRAGATGVEIGEDGIGVVSSIGEGQYGAAIIDGALWGIGLKGDLGGDELDEALQDASVVDTYQAYLGTGMNSKEALEALGDEDAKELQKLVPDYTDSKTVAEAAKDANQELAQARKVTGLVDEPKDFIKDHFLTDPATKAVAQFLDTAGAGTGTGSGGN
ncbi:MAG TPA: hypothetical protein VMA77_13850 [Solirubrobacteraceae bacterium]|nr:hypothetical protein [Solirubrobacteraceae bacterium]